MSSCVLSPDQAIKVPTVPVNGGTLLEAEQADNFKFHVPSLLRSPVLQMEMEPHPTS